MKSFYSILNTPLRPAAQEYINIGLLLAGERKIFFKFSNQKLALIKKLIPETSFNLLKSYVLGLTENIKLENDLIRNKFVNKDFVNYLSNYNSNLVTFSKPTPIDLDASEKNFRSLFEKFVFSFEDDFVQELKTKTLTIKDQLRTNLYPRIKANVNIDQVITPIEVPTLLVPSVKINFIGQNNLQVAGQAIDFEKSAEQITNGISRLISLIKAFDMAKKKGQYYIVGKEPKKSLKEQHANWKHIRDSDLIEFVDIEQVDQISDYIEHHNVKPLVVSE